MKRSLGLGYTRNVVLVAVSRFFTGVGMTAAWVTLMSFGYELKGTSTGMATLLILASLPSLLLAPAAGALADRCAKRDLAMISRLLCAAVLVGFLSAVRTGSPALLSLLVLALGALTGFLHTPFDAYVLELFDQEDLPRANSLVQSVRSLSAFVGPALGGVILMLGAPPVAFVLCAGSMAASALPLLFLPRSAGRGSKRAESQGSVEVRFLFRDLGEGLRFAGGSPTCRFLLFFFTSFFGIYCLTGGIWMPYCAEVLGPQSGLEATTVYAATDAAVGLSGFLGALFVPRLLKRTGLAWGLFIGAGLSVVELLACGLYPNAYAVVAVLAVTGISLPLLVVPLFALVQRAAAPSFSARTLSALDTAVNAVSLSSFGLGGLIADRVGAVPVFITAGLLLVGFVSVVPFTRGFNRVRGEQAP